jgi:U3 small nucleolar RNA-associated protein 14
METQLPNDEPQMKGWGSWAGYGVKNKRLPSAEEILQRKVNKIKELQKKRKDPHIHNAIINEHRDSAVHHQFNLVLQISR